MKIKGNILIILIIFLGILWCILSHRRDNNIIEGIDDTTDSPPYPTLKMDRDQSNAFSSGLMSTVSDALTKAGANPISANDVTTLFNSLSGIIDGEIAASAATQAALDSAEQSTPVVNTVSRVFSDNTFFLGDKFGDAFCQIYTSPTEMNTQCTKLTSDNCNATSCCIWVNGNKCVSGNAAGPGPMSGMAKTDADYYSYKYQCYGNC